MSVQLHEAPSNMPRKKNCRFRWNTLRLSCQPVNQCTSKQVCETQYQHSDTPSKSACKYRHVEVSFQNQPSTTAHFLSNKTSSGNSNQIVSFTMTIVLFSDLLYRCRMCWQLCVAEYVLQNGQREANFMSLIFCEKRGSICWEYPWVSQRHKSSRRKNVVVRCMLLSPKIHLNWHHHLSGSKNPGKLDILGMLQCWSVWLSIHALCTPTLSLPNHHPQLHVCHPPFLQVPTQNLNPRLLCLQLSCSKPFLW